ncbi:MAG: AAA family ATPase, partial [Gammaproteobacteria bacterium]
MLTQIHLRDFVIVDVLELDIGPGMSVLTGETGAGKSIPLDALGLALGGRAEARLVRHGADRCSVTAAFEVAPDHAVNALLADGDLDAGEDG